MAPVPGANATLLSIRGPAATPDYDQPEAEAGEMLWEWSGTRTGTSAIFVERDAKRTRRDQANERRSADDRILGRTIYLADHFTPAPRPGDTIAWVDDLARAESGVADTVDQSSMNGFRGPIVVSLLPA